MPTNVVKTKADERKWNRAKRLVKSKRKDASYWRRVMTVYMRLKGKRG